MYSKFGNQIALKPIVRSTSENKDAKKDMNTPKPNYHFLTRREKSESKQQQLRPLHTQTIEQHTHVQQIPPVSQHQDKLNTQPNSNAIKLPDWRQYQKQIEKSNSNLELTKRDIPQSNLGASLRSRLIISDSKQNRLPPRPQKQMTPKKNVKELQGQIQEQEYVKSGPKLSNLVYGVITKAGYEGELILHPMEGRMDQGAFVVMDGHGTDGHYVSQYIKEQLNENLRKYFKLFDFTHIFQDIHQKLKGQIEFGSQFSGSTVTVILIRDMTLFCGWVGDSRAVLCRKKGNNDLQAIEVSIDHKPNQQREKLRIEAYGGVVDTYHTFGGLPIGPSRVWIKGAQYPGLAMSRSLGDQIAASVGVSQIPDITSTPLGVDDLFIVLASDGLWEFISNETIVEMVYPYYLKNDQQGAVQKLYQAAYESWRQMNDNVDDITVIVIFLNIV